MKQMDTLIMEKERLCIYMNNKIYLIMGLVCLLGMAVSCWIDDLNNLVLFGFLAVCNEIRHLINWLS